MLIGEHDVLAEYQKYPTIGIDQLIANVEAEGAEVGRQVNRITDTGAKVLLSTIIDVGFSPLRQPPNARRTRTPTAPPS